MFHVGTPQLPSKSDGRNRSCKNGHNFGITPCNALLKKMLGQTATSLRFYFNPLSDSPGTEAIGDTWLDSHDVLMDGIPQYLGSTSFWTKQFQHIQHLMGTVLMPGKAHSSWIILGLESVRDNFG